MVYTILLVLLFQISPFSKPSSKEYSKQTVSNQTEFYFDNIDEGRYVTESLWALLEYAREDNAHKSSIIGKGVERGHRWVEFLEKNENIFESIHMVSVYFDDERLQLFLQLIIPNEQRRDKTRFLKEFYTHSQKNHLKELNRALSIADQVNSELLTWNDWNFTLFLLSNYFREVNFESRDNFLNYYLNWIKSHNNSNNLGNFNKQLFELFKFQIYYQSQKDNLIAQNHDDFLDFSLIPDTKLKRNMYRAFDFSLRITGNLSKSLQLQRNYIQPLSQFLGDESSVNSSLVTQGAYLYRLGKYREAKSVFDSVLEKGGELGTNLNTRVLNNLGLVHFMLGENDNYIKNQFAALRLAQDEENSEFVIRIHRNLFQFYRKNQDWDRALSNLTTGIELAEKTGNSEMMAELHISMAVYFYESQEDYKKAHHHLDIAKTANKTIDNKVIGSRLLFERSNVFQLQKKYAESYDYLNEALQLASEENNTRDYLTALVKMMEIDYIRGDYNNLRVNLNNFYSHDVSVLNFHFLAQANHLEAQLATHDGNYTKARDILERTVELVLDRARNTSQRETGYWSVEPEYLQIFESYTDFLIQNNRSDAALRFLDRVKTINDASMVENPLVKAEVLTEEELNREQQINIKMDQLRKKMITAGPDDRMSLQNQIEVLSAQKREITSKLNNSVLQKPKPVWVLQQNLRPTELLVHLSQVGDNLYITKLTQENLDIRKLAVTNEIDALFEDAILSMVEGKTDLHKLHQVYILLELDRVPDTIDSITMIPDSYMHQLPLDVLPVQRPASPVSYGSAKYLVERMKVRYLNNLNELHDVNDRQNYTYDFAGFGISDFSRNGQKNLVSLPKAPMEVQTAAYQLSRFDNNNTLIEEEATPYSFRNVAPASRILHMATHSEVSESDPLFSRLFLNPESGFKDSTLAGQLFAYELFNLNLQNELIMLNSCESGAGQYLQGTGIMGISRALRYAGAQSLVLNGWSVNDQFASEFAIEFYGHLNEGLSKSESLRRAKLHFIKNRNANPHFWGPYMLNGDDRPLLQKTGNLRVQLFLASLFALGLALSVKRRAKNT
ncbi:MAG TPA: CHAT domain-containing protein [Balneolaceae bacterium]|nr:CHAT domain-containing protein [Balneolaceae bacterium]